MKPTDTPTRRTILGAGLGALAAFVAHAVGRPAAAEADNGDVIRVGDGHSATNLTYLYNIANSNEVFQAETRTGVAIRGISRE